MGSSLTCLDRAHPQLSGAMIPVPLGSPPLGCRNEACQLSSAVHWQSTLSKNVPSYPTPCRMKRRYFKPPRKLAFRKSYLWTEGATTELPWSRCEGYTLNPAESIGVAVPGMQRLRLDPRKMRLPISPVRH